MAKNGIRLSPKHGVNPSMGLCFLCGKPDGTIILPGRLQGDAEAPHQAVWSLQARCAECLDFMKWGIVLIEVADDASGDNPERMGGFAVITEEGFRRVFRGPDVLWEQIVQERVTWVPRTVWRGMGLDTMRTDGGRAGL